MDNSMIKRAIWRVILGLVVGGMLTAPGRGTAVAAGGTITILRTIDSRTQDIHKLFARSIAEVLYMMTDTLVSIEDDLKTIHPGLAKSWTVSSDGLTYTFTLREDVTFHDGKPMTAADVEYSFKRWLAPETRSPTVANLGAKVKEVRATGKYTVEFTLEEPFTEFLGHLTQPYAGIIDQKTVEKLGADFGIKGFNGTGPFAWESWIPRDRLVLRRHEGYKWGPPMYENRGPAHVERVIWKMAPEDTARVAALMTGQADISYMIPFSALKQLRAHPDITIVEPRFYGWVAYVGFKVERELVSDPRVRKAMSLAIDKSEICKTIWFGAAVPAYTIVDPLTLDYDKSIESKAVKYDPAEANRILDEVGWKMGSDGFRYKGGKKLAPLLYGQNNTFWRERLESVQGYLRAIGVDLQLRLWEPAVGMSKMLTEKGYEMYALFATYMSMGELYNKYLLSHGRLSPFRDLPKEKTKVLDDLVNKGKSALTAEERFAYYSKAFHMFYDSHAWIPLGREPMLVTYNNKRVTGVKPHSQSACGLYKGLDIKVIK